MKKLTRRGLASTIEALLRTYDEFSHCAFRTNEIIRAKLNDGTEVIVRIEFKQGE